MNYVNQERLDKAIEWFVNYIIYKQKNTNIDFYSGYMEEHEGYKRQIYINAHDKLQLHKWSEDMIGKRIILDNVLEGLNAKSNKGNNNIISFYDINKLEKRANEDIELAEDILYRLFKDENVKEAFDDFCEFFGKWFPALSYLLFIRDSTKYIHVKSGPDNHPDRFKKLGISTDCFDECNWGNYQFFINVHKEIQTRLDECFGDEMGKPVTLLDAHSFVWILYYATDDLSFFKNDNIAKNKNEEKYINEVIFSRDYKMNSEKMKQQINREMEQCIYEGKEREAIVKVRCNQGVFRKRLLIRYGEKCCLCGVHNEKFLIASHIKPWSESESGEQLAVDNGLLLCPNHDKLFDQGWISFSDEGKIIISKKIDPIDKVFMNIDDNMKIQIKEGNKKYMNYHRSKIFIDED